MYTYIYMYVRIVYHAWLQSNARTYIYIYIVSEECTVSIKLYIRAAEKWTSLCKTRFCVLSGAHLTCLQKLTCSFVLIVLVTSVVQGTVCWCVLVLFVAAYLLLMMIACSVAAEFWTIAISSLILMIVTSHIHLKIHDYNIVLQI